MNSLSSGGLWFLSEEDFKVLRPLAQALQPKGETVISYLYQLYTAHFKPPRSFSEAEFVATFGPHFTRAVAMLIEADRESWAVHAHQLGESLAERGVPFVELLPLFHLFWESVMTVGSEAIDLTFAIQKSFGKLCHVRAIQLTDAYFRNWAAQQGARIVGVAEAVIRAAHEDDLTEVLGLWQEAGVTPPSVTDSLEGLTLLIREPAALLLVATIDGRIVGSVIGGWDGWRGNIYRLAVAPLIGGEG